MSQNTILQFLKRRYPDFFTCQEIAKATRVSVSCTTTSLFKLRRDNAVVHKKGKNRYYNVIIYRYKKTW